MSVPCLAANETYTTISEPSINPTQATPSVRHGDSISNEDRLTADKAVTVNLTDAAFLAFQGLEILALPNLPPPDGRGDYIVEGAFFELHVDRIPLSQPQTIDGESPQLLTLS
jgi:hypothetical protein